MCQIAEFLDKLLVKLTSVLFENEQANDKIATTNRYVKLQHFQKSVKLAEPGCFTKTKKRANFIFYNKLTKKLPQLVHV